MFNSLKRQEMKPSFLLRQKFLTSLTNIFVENWKLSPQWLQLRLRALICIKTIAVHIYSAWTCFSGGIYPSPPPPTSTRAIQILNSLIWHHLSLNNKKLFLCITDDSLRLEKLLIFLPDDNRVGSTGCMSTDHQHIFWEENTFRLHKKIHLKNHLQFKIVSGYGEQLHFAFGELHKQDCPRAWKVQVSNEAPTQCGCTFFDACRNYLS